mgnify:CR=1 FL=1|tara:strand:- start:1260 stop:1982 length:723 start_codon:yes stop_codon:yes gene_type:complete
MNLRNKINKVLKERAEEGPRCCEGGGCDTGCSGKLCDTKGGKWTCFEKEEDPENKTVKKAKKEQTTAGAAGAYSQPLFGKPMKGKVKENKLGGTCTCKKCGAQSTTSDEQACANWITTHKETCSGSKSDDVKSVKKTRIGESELISLIEESVKTAINGGNITEALTDTDERRIGVIARKELKDYEVKIEKKIDSLISKAFKGKELEDKVVSISRNALVQLYKALWIKRSFWTSYIKNSDS